MEITLKDGLVLITSEKRTVHFTHSGIVVDDVLYDFPGEYEKSDIMFQIKKLSEEHCLISSKIEGKSIAFLPIETLEITEAITDFFGNIDCLILPGSKNSVKTFENIEAKVVVPYGEERDLFFTTLAQHGDAVEKYKTKEADFEGDATIFVRLG